MILPKSLLGFSFTLCCGKINAAAVGEGGLAPKYVIANTINNFHVHGHLHVAQRSRGGSEVREVDEVNSESPLRPIL